MTELDPSSTAVVIVGAGLSGLIAARELQRHDVDFLVLEAADRIGGRSMAETTSLGSRVDLGGQWIGHDHHRIAALASELGATQFTMHTKGMPTLLDSRRRLSMASPAFVWAALLLVVVQILVWIAPRRWKNKSVASLLARVPGPRTRRLLQVVADISWTADLDKMTFKSMVNMIRGQHGLRTMLATKGGAQDTLVEEGIGSLSERLATEAGSRVRTGHRVTAVIQHATGVTIQTSRGDVHASKVIVTVPPPMARSIRFEPPLPAEITKLQETTHMGSVYKAIAVYEEPFWRDGAGGEFMVLDNPARAVFDSGSPSGPGHLVILVGGPTARELSDLDSSERQERLLADLVPQIGARVLSPASWHEKSWHLDEDAGGGYMALTTAASPFELPFPHEPIGHIHWAGTETAHDHPGYLDGAIEAGERAANEVSPANDLTCRG